MKTFTLSEAIAFIQKETIYKDCKLVSIRYKHEWENECEFIAAFDNGFVLYINMDDFSYKEHEF